MSQEMNQDDQVIKEGCNDVVYIKQDATYHRIYLSEVNWIYAKGNYCTILMEDAKEYMVRISLANMLAHISSILLVRCHRNYVINAKKIEQYSLTGHLLIANQEIPVGKKYKREVEKLLCLID